MGSLACGHALRTIGLPDFLVPALATPLRCRSFASSAQCRSRIGAAPLSIPPEVEVTLLPPPRSKRNVAIRRVAPPQQVEIKGPLGRQTSKRHVLVLLMADTGILNLKIPSYMDLKQDAETRKATLSVPDREERKQREMWGTLTTAASTASNH